MANGRRRVKSILSVQSENRTLELHNEMDQAFFQYYRPIFGQTVSHITKLRWKELYPHDDWGPEELERPFSEEEIKEAIFIMAGDKL